MMVTMRMLKRGRAVLLLWCALACATSREPGRRAGPESGRPIALPVKYAEDRFFVQPKTASGAQVTLCTDTGGGLFLLKTAVRRLNLTVTSMEGDGGEKIDGALLPPFAPGGAIPLVDVFGGRLPVVSDHQAQSFDEADGLLGQSWFGNRVWTFDYPGRALWLRAAGDLPPHDPQHRVGLGFPSNALGQRQTNYPRIQIQVDGETLDLLFDTGAMVRLTESALAQLDDGRPAVRATSFITRSTMEKWSKRHQDWRVLQRADRNLDDAPMIEVPTIRVAGHSVGPVWFTQRADRNFHEWMSQWMDKPIDGALGGSALHYFRVTVDYPNAVAVFERAP
jgi:hypothetical protein